MIALRRPIAGLADPAMRQGRFNPVPGAPARDPE
jgi:hypothetical protein